MTALGIASWKGNTEMVSMLLHAGADVNHRDSEVSAAVGLAVHGRKCARVARMMCLGNR
jgi:hypothetical protein